MTKYVLTKSDIDELSMVINIEGSIQEHYNELAKLEIEGKKDTPEYNSCIERLKSTLSLENGLLQKLMSSVEKVIELIDYMKQNFGGGYTLKTPFFEIIANGNFFHIKEVRVFKKLDNYLGNNLGWYLRTQISKPLEVLIELDHEFIQKITNTFLSRVSTHDALINEQHMFILTKLEEEIDSPFSRNEKNELIKAKYRFAYIDDFIEKTLLESNFKVPREIYSWLDFIAKSNKIPNSELGLLKETVAIKEIADEVSTIMLHKDKAYNNNSNLLIELKIRKIVIRGLLQILTDEQVMDCNDAFHSLIEDEGLDNGEYEIGIKAISDAYKQYKRDKKSIVTLSLIGK